MKGVFCEIHVYLARQNESASSAVSKAKKLKIRMLTFRWPFGECVLQCS